MNWEIFIASFTGSLIELVEILGVVIVVGRLAGWRNALVGSVSGIGVTIVISLILGKSLACRDCPCGSHVECYRRKMVGSHWWNFSCRSWVNLFCIPV